LHADELDGGVGIVEAGVEEPGVFGGRGSLVAEPPYAGLTGSWREAAA
jgi:hypothetical protein